MSNEQDELSILRDENKRLRSRLYQIDAFFPIRESLPNLDQARSLLKITRAAHSRLKPPQYLVAIDEYEREERERVDLENFVAAMGYVFSLTKTETPTTKYASSTWVDRAQTWARAAGFCGVPRSLILPIIACADVQWCWTADQLWLDLDGRGAAIDRSRWKKILSGEADLLPPREIPMRALDESIGAVKVQSVW